MIQRYDMPGGSIEVALHTGELVPSPDGELMLHSEHVKAMKELQDKLEAVEREVAMCQSRVRVLGNAP
jgi:hypothetical protein